MNNEVLYIRCCGAPDCDTVSAIIIVLTPTLHAPSLPFLRLPLVSLARHTGRSPHRGHGRATPTGQDMHATCQQAELYECTTLVHAISHRHTSDTRVVAHTTGRAVHMAHA